MNSDLEPKHATPWTWLRTLQLKARATSQTKGISASTRDWLPGMRVLQFYALHRIMAILRYFPPNCGLDPDTAPFQGVVHAQFSCDGCGKMDHSWSGVRTLGSPLLSSASLFRRCIFTLLGWSASSIPVVMRGLVGAGSKPSVAGLRSPLLCYGHHPLVGHLSQLVGE